MSIKIAWINPYLEITLSISVMSLSLQGLLEGVVCTDEDDMFKARIESWVFLLLLLDTWLKLFNL